MNYFSYPATPNSISQTALHRLKIFIHTLTQIISGPNFRYDQFYKPLPSLHL